MRYLLLWVLLHAAATAQEIITYGPWKGYWQQARLSAYSPHDALDKAYRETKGERWRWITADGRTDVRRQPHGIAAPGSLPFGTRIFIPQGLGFLDRSLSLPSARCLVVDDRGSAIQSGDVPEGIIRLDLRYRTEYSAINFGIKDAWVFILTGDALSLAKDERK
jgi:3D (Asp-Asp-Asp) domain-containing protein